MSINNAKWTVAPMVLASSITIFLNLTLIKFHAEIFFSHSLSTAAFAAGIFIWIFTFSCNMVFVIWRFRIPHTHSGRFIGFQNTRTFCFDFVGSTTPTVLHNFTRHTRSHWCLQLSTHILDVFLKFLILGVDENRSHTIFLRFQGGSSLQTTFASPSAQRSFPLTSIFLAINDLAWM